MTHVHFVHVFWAGVRLSRSPSAIHSWSCPSHLSDPQKYKYNLYSDLVDVLQDCLVEVASAGKFSLSQRKVSLLHQFSHQLFGLNDFLQDASELQLQRVGFLLQQPVTCLSSLQTTWGRLWDKLRGITLQKYSPFIRVWAPREGKMLILSALMASQLTSCLQLIRNICITLRK